MATVNPVITHVGKFKDDAHTVLWEALTNTNQDGGRVEMPGSSDRSIQCEGTFGGATITVQGSNEVTPTNWETLTDVHGNPCTFTAAGIKAVAEITRWIRPLLSGGAGSDVDVTGMFRRTDGK